MNKLDPIEDLARIGIILTGIIDSPVFDFIAKKQYVEHFIEKYSDRDRLEHLHMQLRLLKEQLNIAWDISMRDDE